MKQIFKIILAACLGSWFLACDTIIDEDGFVETGLEGTVLKGPMCPVEREDQPCPDQPFAALFHVFNATAIRVATFESDSSGFFRIHLNPGEFIIVPDETAPIIHPTSQSQNVTVGEDGFTQIDLNFDTGIR